MTGIQKLRGKAASPGAQLGAVEYVYEDGTARLKSQKTVTPFGSDTLTLTYGSSADGTSPNRVASINGSHFGQINYLYDDLGRLSYRNLWDAHLFTHYTYEDIGASGRTTTRISSVTSGGTTLNYTYDADGRIKTVKNGDTLRESYTYDTFGRLSTAFGPSVMSAYSYDTNGNLTEKNEMGVTTTYAYTDSAWGDLLTNYNGTLLYYDQIGNPLYWRDGMAMTWQHGRELATVTKGGKTFAYSYGADGVRTQKTVDGVTTEYYTVGGKLLAEKSGDRVLTFHYDEKGTPYALELNGTRYYYRYNLQGDVIGLYSTTGAVVAEYTYDPWGKLLSITDTSGTDIGTINPLRYRGYYYDTETGFYFLQSRYYDPTVGRFINADGYVSTGQGISDYNMFAYCGNDPVDRSDPNGKFWGTAIIVGVAAALLALTGCSRDTSTTVTPSNKNVELVLPSKKPSAKYKATVVARSKDRKAVALTIIGEAGGRFQTNEWKQGQEAVAWTIINRYKSSSFPNDWVEIVTAPNQFLGYAAAKNLYEQNALDTICWDHAYAIAGNVVMQEYEKIPYPNGSTPKHLYFRADTGRRYDAWGGAVSIGGNVFFYYK